MTTDRYFGDMFLRTIPLQSLQECVLFCLVTCDQKRYVFGLTVHKNLRHDNPSEKAVSKDRSHTDGPTNAGMVWSLINSHESNRTWSELMKCFQTLKWTTKYRSFPKMLMCDKSTFSNKLCVGTYVYLIIIHNQFGLENIKKKAISYHKVPWYIWYL